MPGDGARHALERARARLPRGRSRRTDRQRRVPDRALDGAARAAVESGNRPAASAAAHALLATGHMTNLRVTRDGRRRSSPSAAPRWRRCTGRSPARAGTPIASYLASVWADNGFLTEADGITQGLVALLRAHRRRAQHRRLARARTRTLPTEGTLTLDRRRATSTPRSRSQAYPSGALRVYLLIPLELHARAVRHDAQDTTVNTLQRVAKLIYAGELGRSAQKQVRARAAQPGAAGSGRRPRTGRHRSARSRRCSTSTSCACA